MVNCGMPVTSDHSGVMSGRGLPSAKATAAIKKMNSRGGFGLGQRLEQWRTARLDARRSRLVSKGSDSKIVGSRDSVLAGQRWEWIPRLVQAYGRSVRVYGMTRMWSVRFSHGQRAMAGLGSQIRRMVE